MQLTSDRDGHDPHAVAERAGRGTVFDVAIVGYGPAGQVAAGLLGQRGLSVYVCDRLTDVYQIPRAVALDHEIMRVFQQLGVVEAILPLTEPFTDSEYFGADGQLIRRMTMVAPPFPQGYTPSLVFTQPAVERALRARVGEFANVHVALGAEMRRIAQDANGVALEVEQGGERRTVREVRDRLRRRRQQRAHPARNGTGGPGLRRAVAGGGRARW